MHSYSAVFLSLRPHTLWSFPGPPTPFSLLLSLSLLAGSSISHAWLPQAVQGNECKMPSWLKMRIISVSAEMGPTVAPCHLTAHRSFERVVDLSLFFFATHMGISLYERKKTAFVLLILRFFYNQGCRAFLCWCGIRFIKPMCCVDLGTWNLAGSADLKGSLIYI